MRISERETHGAAACFVFKRLNWYRYNTSDRYFEERNFNIPTKAVKSRLDEITKAIHATLNLLKSLHMVLNLFFEVVLPKLRVRFHVCCFISLS